MPDPEIQKLRERISILEARQEQTEIDLEKLLNVLVDYRSKELVELRGMINRMAPRLDSRLTG